MDGIQDLLDSVPADRISEALWQLFDVLPRICRESPGEAAAAAVVLMSTIRTSAQDCMGQIDALQRLAERYTDQPKREVVPGITEATDHVRAVFVDGDVRLVVTTPAYEPRWTIAL